MYDGDPRNSMERSSPFSNNSDKSIYSGSVKRSEEETSASSTKDLINKVSNSETVSSSCSQHLLHSNPTSTSSKDQETHDSSKESSKSQLGRLKQTESDHQIDLNHLNEHQVHVDIRMIDFAKSTHQAMDSSFVHDGPDHGYIFGLTNLIKILKEFRKNAAIETLFPESDDT